MSCFTIVDLIMNQFFAIFACPQVSGAFSDRRPTPWIAKYFVFTNFPTTLRV